MKKILAHGLLAFGLSFSILAKANFSEKSLNQLVESQGYNDLETAGFVSKKVEDLSGDSLRVASRYLGEAFGMGYEYYCPAIRAEAWTHPKDKEKTFVVFSTHDDICDGGNVMGMMVEYEKKVSHHEDGFKITKYSQFNQVAEIGDGYLSILKEKDKKQSALSILHTLVDYLPF